MFHCLALRRSSQGALWCLALSNTRSLGALRAQTFSLRMNLRDPWFGLVRIARISKLLASYWSYISCKRLETLGTQKQTKILIAGFGGEKVGLIFQAAAVMKRENGMQQVIITLPCESLLWEQVLPGDHLPYFSSSSPPPCPAPPRLSFFSSSSVPPLSVSPAVQCASAFFCDLDH